MIYYCCCPQTSLENLENLDCERPHILIRDRRASEINLDPGPLLRMTAKVCSAKRENALTYYRWENVGLLTGSLINDLTDASQNSRVFRLKDFVFKKNKCCALVRLFVCLFLHNVRAAMLD